MSTQMSTLILGAKIFAALQEEARGQTLDEQAFFGVGWKTVVIEDDDVYKAAFQDTGSLSSYSLSGSEFSSKRTDSKTGLRVAVSSRIPQSTRLRADRVARKRVQGISRRIVQNHHLASKRSANSAERGPSSTSLPTFVDGRVSNNSVQANSFSSNKVGLLHHAMNKKVLIKQSSYTSVSLSSHGQRHERMCPSLLYGSKRASSLVHLFSIPDQKH